MNKRCVIIGVVPIMLLVTVFWWRQGSQVPVFPALQGPLHTTVVPDAVPTRLGDYAGSGAHSVAIWVNDPDSSWLGLALGFKSIGVPFRLVTSIDQALEHDVVMVYPTLTGGNTEPDALDRLRAHVETGGTLIGFSVLGGGMSSVFGFQDSQEHAIRSRLAFARSSLVEGLLDVEVERTLQLGDTTIPGSGLPGTHYTGAEQIMASFEDGSAAVTYRLTAGNGHAYAFGLDVGHFILRAFNGRFANMADTYVNAYQPQVDSLLRVLKRIYQRGETDFVTLSPTPHGKSFTALLTHDVDFTRSINNIPDYVALENAFDVPATYFIQTKYMTDYNDRRFFDSSRAETLRLLLDNGMEIASHTVAHSNEFSRMPVGSGNEQYPDYQPFVRDFGVVENATMMGELRVSKFLLESLSGTQIVSFRPGHLSLPEPLPQLLVANGYRYSSSMTANEAMSHLPYRLSHDRSYGSQVDAFEFPVTVEDEQGSLMERFGEIVDLSRQIAQYQGLVTLMIHTDSLGDKLQFVERYLTQFGDTAWFDTLSGYGQWWAAREAVVTEVSGAAGNSRRLRITAPQPITGLTLELPAGWQYQAGLAGSQQLGDRLVLAALDGSVELAFDIAE